MITTDDKLIEMGFKKHNTCRSLSDAKKYLFQKRYVKDDRTLYFMDIYKWDWEIFPLDRIPEPYTYQITTQLYRAGDHTAINIEFGADTTVEDANNFINELFKNGLVEPYE